MNRTLEQLSADIYGTGPMASTLPTELLCATLDALPSRQLLQLRFISPEFASSVDHLLRCRMLSITNSKEYELLFTSCSSMETRPGGQLARLSHFEAGITLGAGEVAILSFVAEIPVPQDLYLDDEEAFGAVSVALHLQAIPPSLPSPPLTPDLDSPSDAAPIPTFTSAIFAPPPPRWDTSLILGSAHPRLFRQWFEDSTLLHSDSKNSKSNASGLSHGHDSIPLGTESLRSLPLVPSRTSSLLSASLRCQLGPPSPPAPSSTFTRQAWTPTPPQQYTYTYNSLTVDVARFVIAAEEGLGLRGAERKGVVLVLGR